MPSIIIPEPGFLRHGTRPYSHNNSYGYTELTVEGDTLTYKQILANGSVFDTTTYTANPNTQVDDYLFDSVAAEISQQRC